MPPSAKPKNESKKVPILEYGVAPLRAQLTKPKVGKRLSSEVDRYWTIAAKDSWPSEETLRAVDFVFRFVHTDRSDQDMHVSSQMALAIILEEYVKDLIRTITEQQCDDDDSGGAAA